MAVYQMFSRRRRDYSRTPHRQFFTKSVIKKIMIMGEGIKLKMYTDDAVFIVGKGK